MAEVDPNMRLLIVEDVVAMRGLMRSLLLQAGFRHIREAENGIEALRQLRQGGGRDVDFVITDWNMPTMTGIQLLQAMRKDPDLARIPLLMVTALSDAAHIQQAVREAVDGYVVKPFNVQILVEKIQSAKASMASRAARTGELTDKLQHTFRLSEVLEEIGAEPYAQTSSGRLPDALDPMKSIERRAAAPGQKRAGAASGAPSPFDRMQQINRLNGGAAAKARPAAWPGAKRTWD